MFDDPLILQRSIKEYMDRLIKLTLKGSIGDAKKTVKSNKVKQGVK